MEAGGRAPAAAHDDSLEGGQQPGHQNRAPATKTQDHAPSGAVASRPMALQGLRRTDGSHSALTVIQNVTELSHSVCWRLLVCNKGAIPDIVPEL